MVTSGAKLTCPTCQQAQDITMNELESYQTKQATEMRCAKRCAISFENDRELFTNVMFADSLLLPEEQDAGEYSSEGAAREWSTVVIVIVIFISWLLFECLL